MPKLELGFYYHYKHDPKKGVNDHTYEVLNIAHHTEIENFADSGFVIYAPIYSDARVYKAGKHWDA